MKGGPPEKAERSLPPELHTGYGSSGPPQGDPTTAPQVWRETRPFEGISDPVPGGLYLGYWSGASAGWYAVVVLPHDDFKSVGISGSLSDTQLTTGHNPVCYRYDKKTRFLTQSSHHWLNISHTMSSYAPLSTRRRQGKIAKLLSHPSWQWPN